MRTVVCTAVILTALGQAHARTATVSGVIKAPGDRSHCSRFAKAYWAFEVPNLPHLPCRPRLNGYIVTLNLWQAKRARTSKGYAVKLYGVQFKPRILIIPKDAQSYDVTIENQDRYKHQIFSPDAPRLGRELIAPNGNRTIQFDKLSPLQEGHLQMFRLRCRFFPHMQGAVAFTRSTAFAVANRRGGFRIRRVPTGKYVLRVYHWGQKVYEKPVTVGKRGANVTVKLGAEAEPAKPRPRTPEARPRENPRKAQAADKKPERKKRRRRRRRR